MFYIFFQFQFFNRLLSLELYSIFSLDEYACTKVSRNYGRERGNIEESRNVGGGILYGLIVVFVLAIFSSLIISLLLTFTSLQESSLQFVVTAISFVSLFIGGLISGGKGKQKGWLLGGLIGLLYSLIIFLFQFLGHDRLFDMQQIIYHSCYILVAMMGGILGVNMSNKSSRTA